MHYLKANRLTSIIPQTNRGMLTKLNMVEKMVQTTDASLLVGYRYGCVMYGTKLKLLDCYNVFSSLSTVDGVPNSIETAFTINPTIYLSNIREVIKDKRSIITKGKTTATPNANQNKAMVDILEALGFYSQSFEKFSTIPTIRKQ